MHTDAEISEAVVRSANPHMGLVSAGRIPAHKQEFLLLGQAAENSESLSMNTSNRIDARDG